MEITAPQEIKALTHPLRLDLLELLAVSGPATAARCGRALGVPQANCSFHLRQLAKYGFVVDAGPGEDRRERIWQLPEERREREDPPWRDTGTVMTAVAICSPEDALEIKDKWKALLEPYLARTAAESQLRAGQRHVRYFMAATPISDPDPEDKDHDSSH
jgi:predicted ArsR family transcriptional regulator